MKMMSNKQLRQMFDRLNKDYFKGKLSCSVKFSDLWEEESDGTCDVDEISVDGMFRRSVPATELILLHEMIHGSGITGHGKNFHKAVDRLYKAGAYKGLL